MDINVEVIAYTPESGNIDIKTIALGHEPAIILEPKVDDENGLMILQVTASMFPGGLTGIAEAMTAFAEMVEETVNNGSISG